MTLGRPRRDFIGALFCPHCNPKTKVRHSPRNPNPGNYGVHRKTRYAIGDVYCRECGKYWRLDQCIIHQDGWWVFFNYNKAQHLETVDSMGGKNEF